MPAKPVIPKHDRHPVVVAINDYVEANAEDGRREHLGGSVIGKKCYSELWYGYRWAVNRKFDGRMYRLFQRGHIEEFSFVEYLRDVNVTVYDYSQRLCMDTITHAYRAIDWEYGVPPGLIDVSINRYHCIAAEKLKIITQFKIKNINGHLGGALDGKGFNIPGLYEKTGLHSQTLCLLEFKTHGDKSFKKLIDNDNVKTTKPEHFDQMQMYMHHHGLLCALYMAVSKNTDHLYCEFVLYDPVAAQDALNKAQAIIYSRKIPRKIASSASNFKCRFCDYKGPCHLGEPMLKGCRTCIHSGPVEDAGWWCDAYSVAITTEQQKIGCSIWREITR